MAVLVTGATGLIGSHVVDLLVEKGENVRAFTRPNESVDRLVKQGVDICRGDMKDRDSLTAAVAGVERVIHCAAHTGAWGPKEEYEAVNVRGLEDLLELALAAGTERFVHVSSVTVHGNDLHGSGDETIPFRIEPNPYSRSKVMGERVVEKYIRDYHAPVTIVRPGWVYGARDTTSFASFAKRTLQGRMIVIGSGNNRVPLIYVTDVADGIVRASFTAGVEGCAYILVNDEPVTQSDYLNCIATELGVPSPKIHLPYQVSLLLAKILERVGHTFHLRRPPPITVHGMHLFGGESRFIIDKARRELKFSPKVNLKDGVRKGISWFKSEYYAER